MRFDNWKLVFLEQRAAGTLRVWAEPFTRLRVPKIFNLRTDPYERADVTSNTYYDWILDHAWVAVPMQAFVFEMIQSFVEFPPRQKPASFSLEDVLATAADGSPQHVTERAEVHILHAVVLQLGRHPEPDLALPARSGRPTSRGFP